MLVSYDARKECEAYSEGLFMFQFKPDYKQLAKALVGRKMIVGSKEVTILEAKGFPKRENETPLYLPIVSMQPGQIYCPRLRNAVLLLVACNDGANIGGCVLVKAIELDDEVIQGPGRVTAALGIEAKSTGHITERDDGTLELHTSLIKPKAVKGKKKSDRPRVPAGIGEETLKKLMPDIAKAFIKRRGELNMNFGAFVDKILTECASEREVKALLKGAPVEK